MTGRGNPLIPRDIAPGPEKLTRLQTGNSGNIEAGPLHVSQAEILRQQFGLRPLSPPGAAQDALSPSSFTSVAPPCLGEALRGGVIQIPPTPAPGVGVRGSGASSSWNPAVFRPETKRVSCYSREINSGVEPSPKPGQGFKKPDCGKWVRKLRAGAIVRDIYHNCGNLGCPACYSGTITDKARDVEARFDLYEQAKKAENAALIPGERSGVKPRQFIFTMTPAHQAELIARVMRSTGKWDPGLFLEFARGELMEGLKLSGLLGGFIVYHDARVRHPDTRNTGSRAKRLILLEAKLAGNFADEDPAWKIYDHIRKQKNSAEYYYFSPHFHTVSFGKAIEAADFEHFCPGWTYHNKGVVENVGGLVRYLLSHMAMLEDRKSCSYFGRMSSRILGKKELRTYDKPQVHEETGLPWMIVASVNPSEIGAQYSTSVTDYEGFFRGRMRYKKRDPGELRFPKSARKRSMAPHGMHDKGILAMARFCDEWGKL
jgi:hypothetical protein